MRSNRPFVCLLAASGGVLFLAARAALSGPHRGGAHPRNSVFAEVSASHGRKGEAGGHSPLLQGSLARQAPARISLPVSFEREPFASAQGSGSDWIARGAPFGVRLNRAGMELDLERETSAAAATIQLRFLDASPAARPQAVHWRGARRLAGVSNYFLGNDPRGWRTRVPHFGMVQASHVLPGISATVYGAPDGFEYDLRAAPGADPARLRISISGASSVRLDHGDALIGAEGREIRMRRPVMYEEFAGRSKARRQDPGSKALNGDYVLEADGTIGFRISGWDRRDALVIDPSLSISYATFLGGAGTEQVAGVAADAAGNIYVCGTTTAPTSFPEAALAKSVGQAGGTSVFFVAKINPSASGANSLDYLTFIGGSGAQAGGTLALDGTGDVAIAGTTTSGNFPVTDGTTPTSGGTNDLIVSELDPTGSILTFSTVFGGNGQESAQAPGGIGFDGAGDIYVASDTTSTNLPVTAGVFQSKYDGGAAGGSSDGFLAVFQPSGSPEVKYCTYFGIAAQVGIGGLAVDSGGNAFVAGFTSALPPGVPFPAKNAMQATYAGGNFDAFVMKIAPAAASQTTAGNDLVYSTLLGGSGSDQARAIAVDQYGTAYVTGTTGSTNFPVTNATAYQPQMQTSAAENAFLAILSDSSVLCYSTYLGGSRSDQGASVIVTGAFAGQCGTQNLQIASEVYVAGTTTSWDFPWHDNLQPFTGSSDAFLAKLNPTISGGPALIYATALGGAAAPGASATSTGNGAAVDSAGGVFVAGGTSAGDFPATATPGNGAQITCSSCGSNPPQPDAFVLKIRENATSEPALRFGAGVVNFGAQPLGNQSASQTIAVYNSGDSALILTSDAGISGANAADFGISFSGCKSGVQIAPGASCSFAVQFTPSQAGWEGANVVLTDTDTGGGAVAGSPQALQLEGVGNGAEASLTATSENFGSVPENATSAAQTITLTNTGNQDLTLAVSTGGAIAQFQLAGGTCLSTSALAPGATCSFQIAFAPTATGIFSAQITLTDNSGGASGATQVISLSGTGTVASPVAALSPPSLDFGTRAVGSQSAAEIVTLTNTGSASLSISSIAIFGQNATEFAIASQGTSCPVAGGNVSLAGNCTVAVVFDPQTAGNKAATLNFTDNAAGSPQTVALSGTASSPAVQVAPSTLGFAAQSVGTTSAAQTISITDTGTAPLAIVGIQVGGANPADFPESNNCPLSLATSASCIISVSFDPVAAGARSAQIAIASNAPGSPQTVSLSGTAVQASASVSPPTLAFPLVLAGTAGAAMSVTVTNTGSGALAVNKISFAGTNAGDFAETDSCSGNTPLSIAPGGTCLIQVTFKPLGDGSRSASLVIADNSANSPQSVPLAGTGMDFGLSDPPGGSGLSASVSPGKTAAYSLQVNSDYGFSGSVALSCDGAPTESSCQVDPANVTIVANSSAPFQVKVTTTAPSSAGIFSFRNVSGRPKFPPLGILLCAVLLLAVLASLERAGALGVRPHRRAAGFAMAGVIAVVLLGGTLAACGGGGGGDPPKSDPGTPAGSYTILVKATATGVSRTINLNLTVQ